MATPAHARIMCPDQPKNQEGSGGDQEGPDTALKNGTAFEDSDDSSSSNVATKGRRDSTMVEPFQDGGGGQTAPQPNSRPSSLNAESSGPYGMDNRPRVNSDYQGYNQSSQRDGPMGVSEDYRNNADNNSYNSHGCDMGYNRYDHGGDITSNNAPQSNKMYPQYNQPQMRPNYGPQPPRNMAMTPQQRPPLGRYPSNTNNSSQQQRFLSGPSIAQQTGPTPTLNQLLQAPNSLQRYHNSYDYNNANNPGLHKNVVDPNAPQYPNSPTGSWGGNMRGNSAGYPQQMSSSMYRNQQGGPMPDPSMKRPYMPPGGQMSSPTSGPTPQGGQPQHYHQYSQQQQQQQPQATQQSRPPMGHSYPQQGAQQYSGMQQAPPSQQQSPSQGPAGYDHQQRQPLAQYGSQTHIPQSQPQHPQQQQQPPPPQQHPPPPQQQQPPPQQPQQQQQLQQSHHQQQQSAPQGAQQQYSGMQQAPPSQQPSPAQGPAGYDHQQRQPLAQYGPQTHLPQSQAQQPPPQQHPPPQQQQQQLQQSQQQPPLSATQDVVCSPVGGAGSSGPDDAQQTEAPSSVGGSTTPGLRNPTTPPHPVVSPHRPVPSPSGPPSVGSPSMSPALGQQQNIPMPPRPSSSQPENSGTSPMAPQGYTQQMAPPAMYGNKMHQGMMSSAGSHMSPYPPQSAHYQQSTYHRPPNAIGMQGYGGQSPSNYQNPVAAPVNYPQQGSMSPHRIPSHPSAAAASVPPTYNTASPGSYPGASQYGSGSATSGPPAPSTYNMNNMMPPPNQYPKSNAMPPPTGGAQAAAQAAVMAAAASSGTIRQSPMYLRQHLQQKMYASGYGNTSMSPVPPGAPGAGGTMGPESTPMPPPSSTPSSQSMGMSTMPPQASTPGSVNSGLSCDNSMPSSIALAGFTQTSAPSLGLPATTITQSISSPVPSAVTVSSPSVMGSDMMQGRGSLCPPPPPIMDEGSQASNASASSSLPEERVETPKPNNKPTMSHPPTPNTLSSPGAASMSSFHDEFESVSSPSWPRTPASPVINNQPYDHHPIKRPDGMLKLYDMSDEPDRRMFLDKLIMYNEERGTPISQCPTISKQPLDLYRLYIACKERGGFVEVMKSKLWKDIAGIIGIGASSSAAYTLRKQYIKHLLPFECKYDRGGIDPGPIISSIESNSRKKTVAKNAVMGNQEGYHQGPMMDGYSSPYPGAYPQSAGPHPGMMPNAEYSGHHGPYSDSMHPGGPMVNHSGSEGTLDPFSDEMPASQYPQRHSSSEGYGYSQPMTNSAMPPYSGNQSNMPPSNQYNYGSQSVGQQEPYGDQYPSNLGPISSDSSYGNRNIPADPYSPPGGYPPNRTVGPSNPPTYPPYQQGPCDQDRYDQQAPQGPMMKPPSTAGMGGATPAQDPSGYPQHRYPNQQMPSRDGMPPQQMGYQGRPTMSQSQYPGPNSQPSGQTSYPQQDSYRGPEYPPQMSRLQSTLIQRLQPKNHTIQNYPPNQQGMYGQSMPPPNKIAPQSNIPGNVYQRDMYSMGPKRHGDFSKPHGPTQDQYHMGSYPQQQSQGPYSDRSQYPYRPTHGVPPLTGPPQQGWPREGRPFPSGPNQYQSNHRENWDMSRHPEGPPTGPGWPRYGGPQSDPYSPHMGPSMGPKMALNRGYMSPNKMQTHPGVGPPPQYGPSSVRKEIIFPPDAVEAVAPIMVKRRRVVAKDLTQIDPWKIMMALKSGLLCESAWALDILSVLICDDSTVLYFGLSHLPGLLEVLMDHYKRCLNLVFDLADDLEVGFIAIDVEKSKSQKEQKWYELDRDFPTIEETRDDSKEVLSGTGVPVLNSINYTTRTRCRKSVKTQQEEALFLFDPHKRWDVYEGFMSGTSHWQHGGGESTNYIQINFENVERCVRFARIMDGKSKEAHCTEDEEARNSMAKTNGGCSKEKHPCDAGRYCKKECNSDTEEDESLCINSPNCNSENTDNDKKVKKGGGTTPKKLGQVDEENVRDTDTMQELTKSVKLEESPDHEEKENTTANGDGDLVEEEEKKSSEVFPRARPMSPNRKRRALEELEDESYNRDEPSLSVTTDAQDALSRRCICISSLLRNLSFVPGNDTEMSKHAGFLMVVGRMLLLHHVHSQRKPPQRHYDREEESETTSVADSCSSLNSDHEWWWDMLHVLRENTLVTLANISGQLDLAPFPEEISFPLLDGLMHWVTCPSSYAQDPLPTQQSQSVLSPQRLSLEALCKLSVLESNVDLMMATPPWQRINRFFSLLAKWLSRNEDQVLREFSVVLLSNLSQADSSMARAIALQGTCIPLLITFVEQAEQSALQVANSQGINALRENPELMGTTLDMVRRAAGTLRCLARVPTNRTLFLQHQQRLLALVMSQILDQGVASIIADVLFECSQDCVDEELRLGWTSSDKPSSPKSPVLAT